MLNILQKMSSIYCFHKIEQRVINKFMYGLYVEVGVKLLTSGNVQECF